jgi:2-polyprenyl-3-methyl-5-hydroxy-6-metoxy-1,4-benzoquinol methylase
MARVAEQIIRLGLGFITSQALRVVADLEIADRLAGGAKSVDDLSVETGAHADALYRIMRVLAAEGVFRETLPRQFELTELGMTLRAGAPSSARDFIRMINREPYIAFSNLSHSVATGRPAFDEVFGKARFDWLADHPAEAELFQRAMIALSQGDNEAVAEAYDFLPYSRVVDVGGGHGQLLSLILDRHQHISGILFDRPSGVDAAKARAESASGRIQFLSGDFFDAVPSGADVYILKRVIHDWDNEQAVKILTKCREGMAPGGRVLIVETIMRAGDAPDPRKFIDAIMLVVTGGAERTEEEYVAMLAEAGLRLERVHATSRPISVLEATRI